MASIECKVHFRNNTGMPLELHRKATEHGVFLSNPPETIGEGETGSWSTGSNGMMTGSEGLVEYKMSSPDRLFFLHWANPYVGSTWQNCHIDIEDGSYSIEGHAGSSSGGRADYDFTASRK